LIPIPIDYQKKQFAQGAKEKLRMQAGTEESLQDFKQCLVGIRIASPSWFTNKSFIVT